MSSGYFSPTMYSDILLQFVLYIVGKYSISDESLMGLERD